MKKQPSALRPPAIIKAPGRCYCVTVVPDTSRFPMDDGITVHVIMPADNPRQARRRVAHYYAGIIQTVRLSSLWWMGQ